MICPCHSGMSYETCCQSFHQGVTKPADALLLMRSRYSAYALSLVDYIIATTHPEHPAFRRSRAEWKKEILAFSKQTQFQGLDILDFTPEQEIAHVTFKADLTQDGKDVSFTERSLFRKRNDHWFYVAATNIH